MQLHHRQIDAFRQVMIQGTTTAAAEAMGVTQPAVSRLISDLELTLGFALFDRQRGRLLPTGNALRLYQGVDMFYSGLNELERLAEQIRTEHPADIRVSATPALSTFVFPQAIARLRQRFPSVQVMVTSSSSAEIATQLTTNLTDLAVTQSFPDTPGIAQETLIRASHVCAVHESHPLASKAVITPDDFEGQEVLTILPSGFSNWNSVAELLDNADIRCSQSMGIQNSHTGYALVAANLAIALIEPFAAPTWRNNGVLARPFSPKVDFEYVLAKPLARQVSGPLEALAEEIKRVFEHFKVEAQSR